MFQPRHVLYDGGCGMCQKTIRLMPWFDWMRLTRKRDITREWDALKAEFPTLDIEACMRDMHVIRGDGRIEFGYDGYRMLAWVLPPLWLILPLLYLPPIRWLGWKIYRRVADSRRACAIEPTGPPPGV